MSFHDDLMERTPDGRRLWQVGYELAVAREQAMAAEVDRLFGLDEERPFGHLTDQELEDELAKAEDCLSLLDEVLGNPHAVVRLDRAEHDRMMADATAETREIERTLADERKREATDRAAEVAAAEAAWPLARHYFDGWGIE